MAWTPCPVHPRAQQETGGEAADSCGLPSVRQNGCGSVLKAKQLPGADRAARRGLDALSEIYTRALETRKDAVKVGFGTASSPRNLPNGDMAESRAKVLHGLKCSSATLSSQGLCDYFQNTNTSNTEGMDTWPQRIRFQALIKAHLEANGLTQEMAAEALGTTVGTLRGWLYNKKVKPNLASLQKAAGILGCSVTEFIDDPGAQVAGQSLGGMSETRRFVARLMLEDLRAEDLTDDDVRIIMEDHQRALERLRALKGRTGR